MALLRKLWAEEVVDFKGDYHHIDRAGLNPLPGRQIPIWFGGFTPVAFRRAARLGDGFIFGSGQEENLAAYDVLHACLLEQGRDPSEFGVEVLLNYQSGPQQWRAEAQAWRERGADYVSMRAMALRGQGDGLDSPQAHIDALATYWDAVADLADT